jgi:hypothetical protein
MADSAQPLSIESLWSLVSAQRIGAYRRGEGNDEEVLARYLWNTALSEALYPSLHFLEVALRNVVFEAAAAAYPPDHAASSWLERPGVLHDAERRTVHAARQRLGRRGVPCEPCRLVAELSFGFWTALFDVRYEQDRVLWPRLFAQKIFAHAPRQKRSRKALSPLLNRVRHLRNRAFHYEPIWHWGDLTEHHALARRPASTGGGRSHNPCSGGGGGGLADIASPNGRAFRRPPHWNGSHRGHRGHRGKR